MVACRFYEEWYGMSKLDEVLRPHHHLGTGLGVFAEKCEYSWWSEVERRDNRVQTSLDFRHTMDSSTTTCTVSEPFRHRQGCSLVYGHSSVTHYGTSDVYFAINSGVALRSIRQGYLFRGEGRVLIGE